MWKMLILTFKWLLTAQGKIFNFAGQFLAEDVQ